MERKIQSLASLGTKNFTVYLDEVSLRNGRISKRIRIDHPQAAAIVPFVSDNEIIMVRQHRYALGRETLEIPAGKIDRGESPEECVKRELVEETGFEAQSIEWLYTYAPAIGYSNELIYLYVGRDLKKLEKDIDENEISSIEIFTLKEVLRMIREHKILDSKTILSLAFIGSLI
ncbi:MAG: NUDIX hydrolase [Deltaproteobacteria bacterium]|nr:NUDIX hydrolase [Deltaproteobacteria bacterium]MBW2341619.1 NUDIX hydrolase [Deltaproteobacteria bacterium]